jgi:hypothetical protein
MPECEFIATAVAFDIVQPMNSTSLIGELTLILMTLEVAWTLLQSPKDELHTFPKEEYLTSPKEERFTYPKEELYTSPKDELHTFPKEE